MGLYLFYLVGLPGAPFPEVPMCHSNMIFHSGKYSRIIPSANFNVFAAPCTIGGIVTPTRKTQVACLLSYLKHQRSSNAIKLFTTIMLCTTGAFGIVSNERMCTKTSNG